MMDNFLPDWLVNAPAWWRIIEMALILGVMFILGYRLGRSGGGEIKSNIPVGTSSVSSDSIFTDEFNEWTPESVEIEESITPHEPIAKGAETIAPEPASQPAPETSDQPDDLTVIDGIGPKLAIILSKNNITDFRELAKTSSLTLRRILDEEGPQFKVHDPTYWPRQAALAQEGQWEELRELQSSLPK